MKIFITIALMLVLGNAAFGQTEGDKRMKEDQKNNAAKSDKNQTKGFWNDEKLLEPNFSKATVRDFCDDITLPEDPTNEIFEYMFEQRLFETAGGDIKLGLVESEKIKVRNFWDKNKLKLECTSSNGNALKLAIERSFFMLILHLADEYQLDLNFVDPSDNRNLLDYVNHEIKRIDPSDNKDNPATLKLRNYRHHLINKGAKPSIKPGI